MQKQKIIYVQHGHEIKGVDAGGKGWGGWKRIKGGKWNYYDSIINKIHLQNDKFNSH